MKRFQRPSPAIVIALIALFAALSGAAVALPGKNSVDSGDVKKNSLKGKDIKESTLGQVPNAGTANALAAGVPQVSAWGVVNAGAGLVRGSGVNSIVTNGPFIYCFDLATPATSLSATPSVDSPTRTIATGDAPARSDLLGCPASHSDAGVFLENDGAGSPQPFQVQFFK